MIASKFWAGRNVFVTGVNGFIGGNLANRLCRLGANVVGLIRNIKKDTYLYYEGVADRVTLIQGDLSDVELLRRIFCEERIECCFHLAAQVEVGVATAYPFLTWETNVKGTYGLLEAARQSKATLAAMIVASSDKAYGSYAKGKMPYQEDYPLQPVFTYDVSKACADMIARSYAASLPFGLPVAVTRFSNTYGPGQLNFSAVIPDAFRAALGYGRFVPRGNGMQVRDFIYVSDVVDLYLAIGESLAKNPALAGEVFNAGTNQPKLIKDVVFEVFEIANNRQGYEEEVEQLWAEGNAAGEIDCQFMDYEKVNRYFGWKPETDLSTGLKLTAQWFARYLRDRTNTRD